MKKTVLFILFIFIIQNMKAQFFSTVIDEMELQFKVKQIDEFMQRFNYTITYDGSLPSEEKDSITYQENRIKNMLTLFNLDQFADKNRVPNKETLDFIHYVIDNKYQLNYADSTWNAMLKCNGTMMGQERIIDLYLRVEQIKDVEYKWVVYDIKGKLFETLSDSIKRPMFISPAEHGIGFISLPGMIKSNPQAIGSIDFKNHKNDNLSVFNYLVATKSLKINGIDKIIYSFNLGKYCFTVERIEKEKSYNKGWLINNLQIEK